MTNLFLFFNTILYSLCNNKGAPVAVQRLAVKAARFLLEDQGFDEIVVEDFLEGEKVLLLAFSLEFSNYLFIYYFYSPCMEFNSFLLAVTLFYFFYSGVNFYSGV